MWRRIQEVFTGIIILLAMLLAVAPVFGASPE